ncbi:MAG: hypothetical protein IIY77_04935, partial [Lachnospiraceae bacterium]|nr:hypothetical protein [Lachnospiraceae bacterium]
HKVTWNDVTVDVGKWNITEEDALEIRPLGTRTCDTLESDLHMYDFSLASGKHEFYTNVNITVPRKGGENSSRIVTYNETTGSWEPLPYEVSEDGNWITYRKTHFSTDAEMVTKKIAWMSGEGFFKLEDVPVRRDISYDILLPRLVLDKAALRRYLEFDDGFVEKVLNAGGLTSNAVASAQYDAFNNAFGWGDFGAGLIKLANDKLITDFVGKSLSWVALAATLGKVTYQVSRNPDKYAAIKANAFDILSATATTVALHSKNPWAGVVALACFALPYVYSGLTESYKETFYEYVVYKHILQKGVQIQAAGRTFTVHLNGNGWDAPISAVCLSVFKEGKKPADCAAELAGLYDQFLNNFLRLSTDDKQLYADAYANTLRYHKIWSVEQQEYVILDDYPGWRKWREFPEDTWKGWVEDFQTEVYKNTKDIIEDEIRILSDMCEIKMTKEIENVLLPYMNRTLEFSVTDLALDQDKQWFYDSPYSAGARVLYESDIWGIGKLPITFPDRTRVQFFPYPLTEHSYEYSGKTAFDLFVRKNTNTILKCRFYNYLQIGAPSSIRFEGYGEENPPVVKEFTVPKSSTSAYIPINIVLNSEPLLYDFWNTSLDEATIVKYNNVPEMMLLDHLRKAELKKSADGKFIVTFKPDGVVDYDKETMRKFLGCGEDTPDYRSTKITYQLTKNSTITGTAPKDGEESEDLKANMGLTGNAEIWEHVEYVEDEIYTAGIRQKLSLSLEGTGKGRSFITELPGRTGKYEIVELTLDLDAYAKATDGQIISYSGPGEVNPSSVSDGESQTQMNGVVVRFICRDPIPENEAGN